MGICFKKAFTDPDTNRDLILDYLKEKNFTARPIITAFHVEDLDYFDKVTGVTDAGYKVHWAEYKKPEMINFYSSIDDVYAKYSDVSIVDVIIEFCGKNLFLWTSEIDYYVLFGDKDLIKKINLEKYNTEYSLESIDMEKDINVKKYFNEFYNKYNVSF